MKSNYRLQDISANGSGIEILGGISLRPSREVTPDRTFSLSQSEEFREEEEAEADRREEEHNDDPNSDSGTSGQGTDDYGLCFYDS